MTHSQGTPLAAPAQPDRQELHGNLRQMIAVLQDERQALATLKAEVLLDVTRQKEGLCEELSKFGSHPMDEETQALAHTAKALNDVNRRVRNLLAANVAGRLETLGGQRHAYDASSGPGTASSSATA